MARAILWTSLFRWGNVDIAADEKMNLENHQHQYDKVSWNDYDIFIEPLQVRYQTELCRNREERIIAIEEYMNYT